MNKLAKRYLISGAIGTTAMLTTLGVVLYKAADKMHRADGVITPSPVDAALAPSASADHAVTPMGVRDGNEKK